MTQSQGNVRGVGRSRGGATDTTMLIWKVIEANPGIDRAGIWERVENGIPEGYAIRRYLQFRKTAGTGIRLPDPTCSLMPARKFVLRRALANLKYRGSITVAGTGDEATYTVVRELTYRGNPDVVDHTGTKAAEHMAVADALRTLEKATARANNESTHGPWLTIRRGKEAEAFKLMLTTLRNS